MRVLQCARLLWLNSLLAVATETPPKVKPRQPPVLSHLGRLRFAIGTSAQRSVAALSCPRTSLAQSSTPCAVNLCRSLRHQASHLPKEGVKLPAACHRGWWKSYEQFPRLLAAHCPFREVERCRDVFLPGSSARRLLVLNQHLTPQPAG